MKADGLEYDERMALLEQITWPQPLRELLEALYETYRQTHPWLPEDALAPKSVVREMWENGMGFTDFVGRYQLARSEGLVLRYLTDAYRTLRQTVPEAHRSPEVEDVIEWLGETVRQTDSSLLDEWEALSDPDHVSSAVAHHEPPPPPRPLSRQERPFRVMLRNAMWARVDAVARDDLDALVRLERDAADRTDPPREVVVGRSAWDAAIEDYYAEHDRVLTDGDARGPELLIVGAERTGEPVGAEEGTTARVRDVRQTIHDPEGHHDWVIEAVVDCDATDEAGELVLATAAMRRLLRLDRLVAGPRPGSPRARHRPRRTARLSTCRQSRRAVGMVQSSSTVDTGPRSSTNAWRSGHERCGFPGSRTVGSSASEMPPMVRPPQPTAVHSPALPRETSSP